MIQEIRFKPKWTQWIRCRVYVSFDCENKPTTSPVKITGLAQIGFIFSHEYDILAFIEKTRRYPCRMEGCERAVSYTFDLKIAVFEKYGLGFGLGHGTGVLGVPVHSHDDMQTFTTECVCCDNHDMNPIQPPQAEPAGEHASQMPMKDTSPVAVVIASSAVGVAATFSFIHPSFWLSQAFLYTTAALTSLSVLAAVSRLLTSRLAKNNDASANKPQLQA